MLLTKILKGDYSASSLYHQIKLPLDIEISIPSDDPVRLLSVFVEGMNLSDLYATYDRIRKNQATSRQMLKITTYAAMNRIYSSRDIESSCKRDINFMFLLDGAPAPEHSTIARFISLHLSRCAKPVMAQVGTILLDLGEISGENIFIDGTKIESFANKYTFVWKKSVSKNMNRLAEKICLFCAECEELYGIKVVYEDKISLHALKRLRKKLYKIKEDEKISKSLRIILRLLLYRAIFLHMKRTRNFHPSRGPGYGSIDFLNTQWCLVQVKSFFTHAGCKALNCSQWE